MKYCIKWFCGGVLRRRTKQTRHLATATVKVLDVRCEKCGFSYEDYEVRNRKVARK